MSLKELARERLAIIRAAETTDETMMKQVKHAPPSCFIGRVEAPSVMKHASPPKSAKNGSCFTVSSPKARNAETSDFPANVVAGLEGLAELCVPKITQPDVWPAIVADALRLARDGWASRAIGLGWDTLDLWGCSPDQGGNSDHNGLAVWLMGRRILLLDAGACIVATTPTLRSVFTRRHRAGAVLLWELGG